MRIEILRKDDDPLVIELWKALFPIKDDRIMIFMSSDLGEHGNQRGLVIYLKGLKADEIRGIQILKPFNPSLRIREEEG